MNNVKRNETNKPNNNSNKDNSNIALSNRFEYPNHNNINNTSTITQFNTIDTKQQSTNTCSNNTTTTTTTNGDDNMKPNFRSILTMMAPFGIALPDSYSPMT